MASMSLGAMPACARLFKICPDGAFACFIDRMPVSNITSLSPVLITRMFCSIPDFVGLDEIVEQELLNFGVRRAAKDLAGEIERPIGDDGRLKAAEIKAVERGRPAVEHRRIRESRDRGADGAGPQCRCAHEHMAARHQPTV